MPDTPTRLDNLRTLQSANVDVAFATAFGTLVSGTFLVGFIQLLGGSDFWIGLLTAVPAFIGILQIPGAVWGRRYSSFRSFIAPGGWAWRLLYLPLIVLPLIQRPSELRLIILTICIGLATAAVQIVSPIYNEWIADLVPANSRGWYFSRRTLISTLVGMLIGFVGAVLLDQFRGQGQAAAGFSLIFAIGCACGILSMVYFLRMKDSVRTEPVRGHVKDTFRMIVEPVKDKNFRNILIFTAIFMASQGFAGSLFAAYAREVLNMSFTILQLTAVAHAIGTIAFVKMWGYLADKYGNKPILALLMIGVILTPGVWLATQPDRPVFNAVVLIVGHLFNGLVWSGVTVAQLNLYMATAKPEDRANYLGAALAVQAIAGGLAPLLGSGMMAGLREAMPAMLAYKYVFGTVMLIRVIATVTLIPVREPGATSLRSTFNQIRRVSPSGVRALRAMTTSKDDFGREAAVRSLGHAQLSMATDELAHALRDPSPRVRRQAAESLGKIGTEAAAMALIEHILTFPELADEETIAALGDAPHSQAVPILVKVLEDPRASLRRAAAKALGRIGDPASLEPLSLAAKEPGDTDLRRAAIQALRIMEARDATQVFGDALLDPHPSVRTASAEAVGELELRSLADTIRQSVEWFPDDALSEMAYALGCVGGVQDLPLILRTAQGAVNDTTRRRCLLGAARLLGVESDLYRMMTLEEIARDNALLQRLRPGIRRNPVIGQALDRYSTGDEAGALRLMADAKPLPMLAVFADHPVEDSFIVAALAYSQYESSSTSQ